MQQVKIANVLLEDTRQFRSAPLLYVRSGGAILERADGSWALVGPGSFDFTTFFNALSVCKYDRYTVAERYRLHLELRGDACSVTQTCADGMDYYPRPQAATTVALPASDEWQEVDIDIAYAPTDALVGFVIEAAGEVAIRRAHYVADVPDGALRDVELALSTTTFRKEGFITHNIGLVRERVLGSEEAIARHFRMYVVDNGRTLDAEALSGGGVTVLPNDNVGGAGGFAYGMLRALEEGDVTHILLMDDDVEVSPESIARTYDLLTILNDEYAGALVSGAMMSYDEPDLRWEDTGYMTSAGKYSPMKEQLRLSSLFGCVTNETFVPDYVAEPDRTQEYAAWWYCCIPLDIVRDVGLPLPLFVRFDDVEYGLRSGAQKMTLNGICVWHLAFDMRYNAAVERYQTMRNGITGQSITGVAPASDFLVEIERSAMLELMKFNYADAELVCEGFEDYLRGPDYFSQRGMAEHRFMEANRRKEQLVPLDELRELAKAELGIDLASVSADWLGYDLMKHGRWVRGRAWDFAHRSLLTRTLNGQLRGSLRPIRDRVAIIEAVGWSYQWDRIYGADVVVAINVPLKAGAIRHRDNERGRQIWGRLQEDLRRYRREGEALRAAYAAERGRLTSVGFWRDYLGLA